MDDIRGSLSKMKKRFKYRLAGGKPKVTGANPGGEGAGSTSLPPRPGPHVAAGESYDREGDRADAARERAPSTDRPPQPDGPESVPARGSDDGQEGGEADVDGGEVSQSHSDPYPDVQAVVGSDGGLEGIYSSPSTPSISHDGRPDSTSVLPDHGPEVPEVARPDEALEPSAAADEKKSNYSESTTSVTAELLRGVRDSTSAFSPLKSIARSLCFILDNCEQTEVNEHAIELLALRVKPLSESLSEPILPGDVNEEERANKLEQKLEEIGQAMGSVATRNDLALFFGIPENARKLNDLVEDIRDALMEYQTSLRRDIHNEGSQQIGDADIRLLESMHPTNGAGYRSGNRLGCLRGTRADVLLQLECWLKDERDHRVFWLNGLAGTGKSTIAQTFAETCFADGRLGASFFCSRDFEDRSNLQTIFPTITFQLAYRYLPFREKLLRVLRANPGIGQESLCSQMERIIVEPLKAARVRTLIIIDALDECKDEQPASAILSVLSRYVDEIPNVKFFITGRPEPRIRSGFRLKSLRPITEVLRLHDVDRSLVDSDIKLFFRIQLTDIAKNRSDCDFRQDWPNPSDINTLCEKGAGFFIYASMVIKFVTFKNCTPTEQLDRIVSLPQNTTHEGRSGIDLLYTQVLEQAIDDMDADAKEIYSRFRTVVGAVLLVFNPLSITALSDLLRMSSISTTLRSLHSLLLIPEGAEDPIRAFHKSFPDFLMDPVRCKDEQFFVEPAVHHVEVLLSCLNLMGERLKRNICNLDDYAVLSEVKDLPTRQKDHIGDALEYACQFWSKHLLRVPGSSFHVGEVQKAIKEFFTRHLVYWIEVLALTGNLGVGVYAMNDIEQWCALAGVSCTWTNDSQRFLLEHFDTIYNSPSHLYQSALPFSPSSSWLHEYYSPELLQEAKVVNGLPAEWGVCSRTVPFDGQPLSLSYWNSTIAVGSINTNILILDVITGSQTAVLPGHTDAVRSLTFSSDGASLVSGSKDKTVKLWDVQTGGVVRTFYGHAGEIFSVSISADHTTIASGSDDGALHLWDVQMGEYRQIIEQQEGVSCVRFSPTDPRCFISISGKTVQQWDIDGHTVGPICDGYQITFSPDGSQFVVCRLWDVTVHNINSGVAVAKFYVVDSNSVFGRSNFSPFTSCCFSPDGKLVAVAIGHNSYVWDITGSEPHLVETFIGHTNYITSLVFSSSSTLISASQDESIKFWQIGTSSTDQIVTDPKSTSITSTSTKPIALKTKNSPIIPNSLTDGVMKTWGILTGLHKGSPQILAQGSHQSNTQLIDDKLIFVWCADRKINIWDAEEGELLQTINISKGSVVDLRVSGDGSKVFCLYMESIQAWDIWTGEVVGKEEFLDERGIFGEGIFGEEGLLGREVGFSGMREMLSSIMGIYAVDGSKVWVKHSIPMICDGIRGLDFGIPGSSPVELFDDPPDMLYLYHTKLWETNMSRMKDIVTGKVVFQLPGRFWKAIHVQWGGQYLVASFKQGEVLVIDFSHVFLE